MTVRHSLEQYALRPLALIGMIFIGALAFFCRLMSVIRYETVIHEFDPYFQYKSTLYLNEKGNTAFQGWLDTDTWYPLSRSMPISLYPGLMYTAEAFLRLCKSIVYTPISVLQASVYMGPVMSVVGSIFSFDIGYIVDESSSTQVMTGLLTALFFSIIPGFIQRSVAGSYDNESSSITAMMIIFDIWLRACTAKQGNIILPFLAALAYFYMAVSWGGYVFLTVLIPLHVFLGILSGIATYQTLLAFKIWQTVGLLSIGLIWREYSGAFSSPIYLPGIGVFFLVILTEYRQILKSKLSPDKYNLLKRQVLICLCVLSALITPVFIKMGLIGKLSGRLLSFINPTYAKRFNPIVASVAEHQPTVWSSFYFNTGFLIVTVPVALYFCILVNRTVPTLFLAAYIATTIWFSAVMARMILISSPAISVCAAYTISKSFETIVNITDKQNKRQSTIQDKSRPKVKEPEWKQDPSAKTVKKFISVIVAILITLAFIVAFIKHSLFCAKEVYSSPSIVLISSQRRENGKAAYIDDFREAYAWLEYNTHPTAKVASWWDYGYQINQIGNKTTLADGLTRSTYWIGLIGAALASDEATAWRICKELNIDYMLILYGGMSGYSGDDLNKFIWPIRISGNRHFERTYPWIAPIDEHNYYANGEYRTDHTASSTMLQSLLLKLSYHNAHQLGMPIDRARNAQFTPSTLQHFEEVFSSQHFIVRIYKVKDSLNF